MAAKHVCHLIWFRNDLRVTDNKALSSACADQMRKSLPFYCNPKQWQQHDMAERQISFIHQNLVELQHSLAELGIPLVCQTVANFADAAQWVYAKTQQADALFLIGNMSGTKTTRQWLINQPHGFAYPCFR